MRLDERAWVVSAGLGDQWVWVRSRLEAAALRRLKKAAAGARRAPSGLDRAQDGFSLLLSRDCPRRRRLLTHPALDYWLHLWETVFSRPVRPEDWRLQLAQLQGFAAGLCWERRGRADLRAVLDPAGRIHLHGGPLSFDFGPEAAGKGVRIVVEPGRLTVAPDGLPPLTATREVLEAREGVVAGEGAAVARRARLIVPGMYFESRDWLCNHGVVMHGLTLPTDAEEVRFVEVLRRAFEETRRFEAPLADELGDMLRLIIPLKTPETMSSVSSSYATMRGLVCLSHSDSSVLQVETLIHEFCHQKMNLLTEADPLLEPGQMGQVYYSPWRKDARRLRGLLLGAHAFLNVARHLQRRVTALSLRDPAYLDDMRNVALRALQVDSSMRTLAFHADYTPFGRDFAALLLRELGEVFVGASGFAPTAWAEARDTARKHRDLWSWAGTGLHRAEGWSDRVARTRARSLELGPQGGTAEAAG